MDEQLQEGLPPAAGPVRRGRHGPDEEERMMSTSNRYLAILVLLGGAMAAPLAVADTVRLGYMPIAEELPKFVANEKGLFKKHGLDVELVRFESGPDMGTALLGRSIQIGMIGTPGLINAAVADRPLVAIVDNGSNVLGASGYEYYTGLVVLEDSPIRTLGDLKGKKIAVNVLKANSEAQTVIQVVRWNKEHPDQALDLSRDVTFVTLPFGSMPTALEKGIVDAASMIEPFMTQLSMRRKVRVIAPVDYALGNWPVSFGIVLRDYGEKNVANLEKYRAAWFEAVDWIRANQDEARLIIQKYAGVPIEVARNIVLPNWSDDIRTTRRKTEEVMQGMLAGGMINKQANLDRIIVHDLRQLGK
jgi:NitT/TauT family transport system substrate-binding protein